MVQLSINGLLPQGIHEYNFTNFKEQFVNQFKTSITRDTILNGAIIFMHNICNIANPTEMWIDGSFVTSKINPNDMDIVLFFNTNDIANCYKDLTNIINNCKQFKCDAYLSINENIENRSYWRGWFTYDRLENPKGLIKLNPIDVSQRINEVIFHA